jgi:hypothetical protein
MHEQTKLREAKYFYGQMINNASDYEAFAFNFSAFLSAARSAMLYALEEASDRSNGQAWYDAQMSSSAVLRFFKCLRNMNIHVQPLKLSKSVTIQVFGAIAPSATLTISKPNAQGNPDEQKVAGWENQIPETLPQKPAKIEHRYNLQEWQGTEDVPSLTRKYLDEITRVIEDGVKKGYISG